MPNRQYHRQLPPLLVAVVIAPLLLTGCTQIHPPAPERGVQRVGTVAEVWASEPIPYAATDSLAAARLADGTVRIFATAKRGDRVDAYDAATGRHLAAFGSTGTGPGEFRYPNGIVTVTFPGPSGASAETSFVLVVERDNARVQAFRPDSLAPAGIFGLGELRRPYGAAVSIRDGGVYLYVTDTEVSAAESVKVYVLGHVGGWVTGELVTWFGDEQGPGRLDEIESIVVDDKYNRIYVCDEPPKNVKVYDRAGRFLGEILGAGLVQGDPEGVVLLDGPEGGYLLLTDQRKDLTVWHAFTRVGGRHVASFTGAPTVANTDGIAVWAESFGPFEGGALFAVHDDRDVRAYQLSEVRQRIVEAVAAGDSE